MIDLIWSFYTARGVQLKLCEDNHCKGGYISVVCERVIRVTDVKVVTGQEIVREKLENFFLIPGKVAG